jgi:hypothetical protein
MTAPGDENYSILAYDYQAGMTPGTGTSTNPQDGEAREGMTDDDLLAIVRDEMSLAVGSLETTPEQRRARLLRRYLGEKYGNEQEGYSAVVSRDVYEVVEWALPQIVETFLAGDQVARFDPIGPEDEGEAAQQTDLANHVFLKENNGFLLLSTAIKDSLIQELGIIHWYWMQSQRVEYEFYEGLTGEQVAINIASNPEMQITAAAPSRFGPELWDVEVSRSFDAGKLCIDAIPPEEFFYSPDARSVEDARCVGRHRVITASEMVDMGYPREMVEELNGDARVAETDGQMARLSRDDGGVGIQPRNNRNDAEREIDLAELWIRIDFDGDGIAELRKVVVASGGSAVSRLISHEPATRKPFAVASPILMPHRLAGISLAETVEDIDEVHTAVLRAYLNGLYLVQRPRTIVLGDAENGPFADTDELMSVVPGGMVTEYMAGAIRPFPSEDVTSQSLAGLEVLKGMREERTGITRTYQGMEAPHGLNDTATGMQMLSNSAGKRLAFIARNFAEGLVKPLFTGIAAELKQHQRVPKVIRLRGQWVNVDPTEWRNDYDATVEVGLGYGDKDQAMFGVQQIMAMQEKLAGFPMTADMVPRDGIWESLKELCKQVGFKNADRFFQDPNGQQPPDPGPSIDEQVLELETQKLAHDAAKLEQEKDLKLRELEVKELDIRLTHEREMFKLGQVVVAPQPDPPISMDLGSMTEAVNALKDTTTGMNGQLATEMAALRAAMMKPKRVSRDETGRIVGVQPEA